MFDYLFESQSREIGPFRFPVYNDLTVQEAEAFDRSEVKSAETRWSMVSLARRIAVEQGITDEQAIALLMQPQDDSQIDMLLGYAAHVQLLMESAVTPQQLQKQLVTVMIRCRGEVRGRDGGWQRADGWTEDDTGRLSRAFLTELWEFLSTERNGGVAPAAAEAQEDGEGKQPKPGRSARRSPRVAAPSSPESGPTGIVSIGA
jgi:hypothetical protein